MNIPIIIKVSIEADDWDDAARAVEKLIGEIPQLKRPQVFVRH